MILRFALRTGFGCTLLTLANAVLLAPGRRFGVGDIVLAALLAAGLIAAVEEHFA